MASCVTLYVFSPMLVLDSLATTTLPTSDIARIALFTLTFSAAMYALSTVVARAIRMDQEGVSAFLLTTLFMNSGNYGIPVTLFAFGQDGMDRAVVFFVTQAMLTGTLAVYLASRSQMDPRGALLSVTRLPLVYASIIGLGINLLNISLPPTLGRPIEILGNAAVPTMLMVLGLQLADRFAIHELRSILASSFLRLVASGGIAYGVTLVLGIGGLTQQVLVILAAMPTAVFTTILATEFQARPTFVTSSVVFSTVASLVTLSVLITVIQKL